MKRGQRSTVNGERAWGAPFTVYRVLFTLLLVAARWSPVTAQDTSGTTRSGVFTSGQASRGKEIYQLTCVSCHTPASHAGPTFAAKWNGKALWELFRYVSEAMPKSEPGSLTERQYTLVLAYLLKMNGMPAGSVELVPDSLALKKILIDLKTDSVP